MRKRVLKWGRDRDLTLMRIAAGAGVAAVIANAVIVGQYLLGGAQ